MSTRFIAQVKTSQQASSTVKTSLFKHSAAKQVQQIKDNDQQLNEAKQSAFQHDFSQVSVQSSYVPFIQPKLIIGKPSDRYEQEADKVADQVISMPEPKTFCGKALSIQRFNPKSTEKLQRQTEATEADQDEEVIQAKSLSIQQLNPQQNETLQRQAEDTAQEDDEDEEVVQAKSLSSLSIHQLNPQQDETLQRQAEDTAQEDDEDEEVVQAKRSSRTPNVNPGLVTSLKASRGGGQPIGEQTRAFMESRFNHDFSQVRVHTDAQANQLARELNAQAFTWKQDIYFGAGYYQPHTQSGKRLLAHELTHTIQQQPKTSNPIPSHQLTNQLKASTTKQPKATSHQQTDGTPVSSLPIANAVPDSQNLISRRVAKPAEQQPLIVTQEKIDKLEAESDLEGPFAPPSAKVSTNETKTPKAPKAPKDKKTPGAEEEPQEETAEQPATEGEATATAADEKAPTSPEEDPAFQAVVKRAKGVAKGQKQHAPATTESKKAQDAAEPPKNEVESKAQDQQVQEMDQQQPGTFSADKFIAALMEKIKNIVPTTEDDAKEFKKNNRVNSVKQEVSSQVTQEKQKASDPIGKRNKEAPNTAGIEPKLVKSLEKQDAGPGPPNLKADQAAPKPKTDAEVTEPFKKNSEELDQQMSDADVTNEQLEKSNEQQFTAALDAKKEAQTDAATAPDAYRQNEKGVLNRAEGQAEEVGQKQTGAMHGQREQLLNQVQEQQTQTKGKDEQERTKVANDIDGIYKKTKTDVEGILNSLDAEVDKRFDAGAEVAKKAFVDFVDREMDAYKEKRYGAWYDVSGWGTRVRDAFKGLPPEVNIIFVKGREIYVNLMHTTLKDIANYVADTLNKAKQRIADGKIDIQKYVAGLSPSLQKFGQEAEKNIQDKFNDLEEQVNSKQEELIDSLAQKYQENLNAIDEDIKKRQEDNKGWIDKAKDKIQGVIETIKKLKQMFEQVLARVQEVAALIIKDPIAFLNNLVGGLKQGFNNFVANIAKHLQSGFLAWLTGTLGSTGIKIPDDVFSLKGIFSLVVQILGLSWPFIREKAAKVFGEPIISALEKGVEKGAEIFQVLITEGPIGLWNQVKEQFSDLKATVMDQIQDLLVTQVIQAGVKWIIGLLNPAAAFVKAAMAIYDIVMFFMERAAQIADFINSVVDAVAAIARGATSGVAQLIENALAQSLPLIIGLLASLLGVGNLAKKVQALIQKIRQKVEKAIENFLLKIKKSKLFQTVSKKVKGFVKKAKKKAKALIKKAKKKAKALVKKVKKKAKALVGKVKKKLGIGKGKDKKTKDKKSKDKKDKDKKKTEKKHAKIGKAVVKALSKKPAKEMPYEELRKQKEEQAKELETKYNQQLEQPVKLKVNFKSPQEDDKDDDLDFHVHIGPNDFDMDGALEVVTDDGSENNPFEISWPKPAAKNYPILYLGGQINTPKLQKDLKAEEGKKDITGNVIKAYSPIVRQPLPGGEIIGLAPQYQIDIETKVGPLSRKTTKGGKKINKILRKYGFIASAEGLDGDHVQEIQFGGPDSDENLWPLNSKVNQGAGATLAQTSVKYHSSNKTKTIPELKKDTSRQYYFKITKVL